MKKLFLLTTFLFASIILFAQTNKYIISGQIENCSDTTASLTIWIGDETINDNISIKNGKFTMEGECDQPMMVRASFKSKKLYKYVDGGGYIPYKCSSLWFLIYPGANAKIKGKLSDFVDAYPYGDKENNLLTKLTKSIYPLMNQCGNIQIKLENKELSTDERNELNQKHDELNNMMMKIQKDFISENTSSYAAIWFMDDMMARKQLYPSEAKKYLINIKDDKYTSIDWFNLVRNRINSTQYAVGNKIPSLISKNTIDGTEFNLESLKGKYVIIDFWGTWCGPCMSGMPTLRTFRDNHNGKVEVLGIAKDNREGWLSVIKEKKLNWIQLLNGKGEEDFVSKFNITGYPTKLLISPDGVILYRESGESEAFYKKIEDLIK